jgi:hypothetical protein
VIINTEKLKDIIETEYSDIVEYVLLPDINELRVFLIDGSFLDIWFSLKLEGRYSYHWERRFIDDTIYRHDNAPHRNWEKVKTFPKHFHNGTEENVIESHISDNPESAVREFLDFIRGKMLG